MPYKDPGKERACARRRYERITAERTARGMCPRCGKAKPMPDRTLCRPCGQKRRRAERARHAKARAAGLPVRRGFGAWSRDGVIAHSPVG